MYFNLNTLWQVWLELLSGLNDINVLSLVHHVCLEKGVVIHLTSLVSPLPKDTLFMLLKSLSETHG